MEVTLFGRELEIVKRVTVPDPPPPRLNVPRLLPINLAAGDPFRPDFVVDTYTHRGMGIYRIEGT
jgi:hypothetical protein